VNTPESDALPIVRDPMYAEAVLIVVVDKPPCKVVNPLAVSTATLVVPPVIVAPPDPVINPPTLKVLETDSLTTVRFVIYALEVLIVVVDKPPCKVVNPATARVPEFVMDTLFE
jgi:hypothetical protein